MSNRLEATVIVLSLCCNDHRNGEFRGVCENIHIEGPEGIYLDLESPWCDKGLKCAIEDRRFRLGKENWWPHYGHTVWHGNWCHDAVLVSPDVAVAVLRFVKAKSYRPDSGTVELWNAFESETGVEARDLAEAIEWHETRQEKP